MSAETAKERPQRWIGVVAVLGGVVLLASLFLVPWWVWAGWGRGGFFVVWTAGLELVLPNPVSKGVEVVVALLSVASVVSGLRWALGRRGSRRLHLILGAVLVLAVIAGLWLLVVGPGRSELSLFGEIESAHPTYGMWAALVGALLAGGACIAMAISRAGRSPSR